jgi:hypothetical protein
MLQRQLGEVGAAMGDLGGRLGVLVSEAALTGVDQHLQSLSEVHGRTIATFAQRQAELGQRLVREIEEGQRSGESINDDEIRALEQELESLAVEAAPEYEELEREIESLTRELEPTRERMRTLSNELRREVDAWRLRHQEILRELEEDGVTVPSYDEDPQPGEPERDERPDPQDDPDPDPVPDVEVAGSAG